MRIQPHPSSSLHRLVCMSCLCQSHQDDSAIRRASDTFFSRVAGRKTLLHAAARDDDRRDDVSEKARAVNWREVRWPTRVACK